LAII
ncbi:hypothetical protein VCHENC02_2301B, partial [Vibrio harveyi]|jgi:hypothetical protein